MQRLILAIAPPTNVVHGFVCWGGCPFGHLPGYHRHDGDLVTRSRLHSRAAGMNQPLLRPDMGVDDALKR